MARSTRSSNRKKAAMKKQPEEEEEASTSSSAIEEEDQVMAEDSEGESSGSDDDDMSDEGSSSGSEQSEDDDDASGSEEEGGDEQHIRDASNNDNGSSDVINNTEHCTFDLNNLLAFNTHQINAAELYQRKGKSNKLNQEWYGNLPTISSAASTQILPAVNEALLLSKAAEGTTQLLQELWKLPTEKTDVGPMAKLPSGGETKLPRSLVSLYHYIISMFAMV